MEEVLGLLAEVGGFGGVLGTLLEELGGGALVGELLGNGVEGGVSDVEEAGTGVHVDHAAEVVAIGFAGALGNDVGGVDDFGQGGAEGVVVHGLFELAVALFDAEVGQHVDGELADALDGVAVLFVEVLDGVEVGGEDDVVVEGGGDVVSLAGEGHAVDEVGADAVDEVGADAGEVGVVAESAVFLEEGGGFGLGAEQAIGLLVALVGIECDAFEEACDSDVGVFGVRVGLVDAFEDGLEEEPDTQGGQADNEQIDEGFDERFEV